MARSSLSIEVTTFLAFSLAFSSRLGGTSVAAMLAELSIMSTYRCPWPPVPLLRNPARASIASATARSWRKSSRLRRSRWKRLLTCRSSRLFRHRSVLDTLTGRRFSLRK